MPRLHENSYLCRPLNQRHIYLIFAHLPLIFTLEGTLSERSDTITIYAMCGFANFGSLGTMIGGIGTMAPLPCAEVAGLGLLSIVSGTFATMLTVTVAGLIH